MTSRVRKIAQTLFSGLRKTHYLLIIVVTIGCIFMRQNMVKLGRMDTDVDHHLNLYDTNEKGVQYKCPLKGRVLIAGIIPNTVDITTATLTWMKILSCRCDYKIHLFTNINGKGIELDNLVNKCGLVVDLLNTDDYNFIKGKNRVQKLGHLRTRQREMNRHHWENNSLDIAAVLDADLKIPPDIDIIGKHFEALSKPGEYDAMMSNGVMFRPYGYYDTYATILKPNTFVYPVHGRIIDQLQEGEDTSIIRSVTEWAQPLDVTQTDIEVRVASENGPFAVRSGFGGFGIYRASIWFNPICSYNIDLTEEEYNKSDLKKFANTLDGGPCDHVVLHECLHTKVGNFSIGIDPKMVTHWNNKRSVMIMWPNVPVPSLKGAEFRVAHAINYFASKNYNVDVCVFQDIADEVGKDVADRIDKAHVPGVNKIWLQNCQDRHDIVFTWSWPHMGYLEWEQKVVNDLMKREFHPKLITVLDDTSMALRFLEGHCSEPINKCSHWQKNDFYDALALKNSTPGVPFMREFGHYHNGVPVPLTARRLWKWEEEMFDLATVRLGISQGTTDFIDKISPERKSKILPFIADKVEGEAIPFDQRQDIIFTGFKNGANKNSLEWFLNKCLPLINERVVINGLVDVPKEFCECSSNGVCISKNPKIVLCNGWVSGEKLDTITRHAKVLINPALERAGVATKSVYAMLRSTPVVSTEEDGTFHSLMPGKYDGAIICKKYDAKCTADSINRLFNDKKYWTQSSNGALNYITRAYPRSEHDNALGEAVDFALESRRKVFFIGDALKNEWSIPSQAWYIVATLAEKFEVIVIGKVQPPIDGVAVFDQAPTNSYANIVLSYSWPPHMESFESFCDVSCRVALILPWEFGSLPQSWIPMINKNVDEVWGLSKTNEAMFHTSGIHPFRTRTVPCIVKCGERITQMKKTGTNKVKFVSTGGFLPRKGFDILLKAWGLDFCNKENAELVMHSSYELGYDEEDISLMENIAKRCHNIRWIRNKWLPAKEHEELVLGADIYVSPLRAEGFGLPILEALLRGQQVVTTSGSGPDDFLNRTISYTINGSPGICTKKPCTIDGNSLCVLLPCADGNCTCTPLVSNANWIEPNFDETRSAMLLAYNDSLVGKSRLGTDTSKRLREKYCYKSKATKLRWERLINVFDGIPSHRIL